MVLMLALVISAGAPRAAAQQAFKGTFSLPTEAYWGSTLLQPGQYSITMSLDQTQGIRVIRVNGDGVRAFMLTGPGIPEDISDRSALLLEKVNGTNVVRQLDAGVLGRSYRFLVAKNVRMKVERASAPSQMAVPIAASSAY
jgi:hypothetical protein